MRQRKAIHELTTVVRVALGRAIAQQWFPAMAKFRLSARYPTGTTAAAGAAGRRRSRTGLADRLLEQARQALQRQEMLSAPPVLLVNHALRPLLARFLRRSLPQMAVLSNPEINDDRQIRMTSTIGAA